MSVLLNNQLSIYNTLNGRCFVLCVVQSGGNLIAHLNRLDYSGILIARCKGIDSIVVFVISIQCVCRCATFSFRCSRY